MTHQDKICSLRWLVLVYLIYTTFACGATWTIFLSFKIFLANYFNMTTMELDGMLLVGIAGMMTASFPLGIYAAMHPRNVKIWIHGTLLTLSFVFLVLGVIFQKRKFSSVLALGLFIVGVASAMLLLLILVTVTIWFKESESATVFGTSGFSFAAGVVFSSSIFTNLNSSKDVGELLPYLFAFGSIASMTLLGIAWYFLPDFPIMASHVEADRIATSRHTSNSTVISVIRQLVDEFKTVIRSRTGITLVTASVTSLTLFLLQISQMPVIQVEDSTNHSNSGNATGMIDNFLSYSHRKISLLINLSVGASLGSFVSGILLDKLKRYHPMAGIITVGSFISSVAMLTTYLLQKQSLMCIACFFSGCFTLSGAPFYTEVTKQHFHLGISEWIQAVIFAVTLGIFCLVFGPVTQLLITQLDPMYFFGLNCVLCLIMCIVVVNISPVFQRYEESNRNGENDCLIFRN